MRILFKDILTCSMIAMYLVEGDVLSVNLRIIKCVFPTFYDSVLSIFRNVPGYIWIYNFF